MVQLYRRKGADMLVNTQTSGHQSAADIAVLPGGGYVVTWADDSGIGGDSSGAGIKAQLFDANGNKPGGEFLVNSTLAGDQFAPTVAALGSGRFVITWGDASATGGDTSSVAVRGQLFESNGIPVGSEFLINTQTYSHQSNTRVTGLAGGGFVVTWADGSGIGGDTSSTGVKAQLFDSSGGKVGGEFLVNTTTEDAQQHASVAALPSGGFAVVWASSAPFGDFGSARLQLFDAAGAKVGGEVVVNSSDSQNFSRTDVAALADGFVVTWAQEDDNPASRLLEFDVRAQRFDFSGAKVGGEFIVHAAIPGNQGDPDVHALPGGGFIITWRAPGQAASPFDVYGQIFDAAGARVGVEFVVSSVVEGRQLGPRVGAMPSGDIVVVWSDESHIGGDSSSFAVKMQILTASSDAPSDISILPATISETAIENVAAATLSATGGLNSSFTYELLDNAGGAFRLEGDRLVVADNGLLDFESAPQMSVTIRATDLNGGTYTEVVNVSISDTLLEKRFSQSPEIRINANQSQHESSPVVLALSSGGFAVHWHQSGDIPEPGRNYVRFFDSAGNATSGDILLAPGVWFDLTMAPLANGGFLTMHSGYYEPTQSYPLRVQMWNSAGEAVGPETLLASAAGDSPNNPAAVTLASGGYVVGWAGRDSGLNGTILAQVFGSDGIPVGGTVTVAPVHTFPPFGLAPTTDGGFVATWKVYATGPGDTSRLHAQFFDAAGAPAGAAVEVPIGNMASYGHGLVALEGGGYVLGWSESVQSLTNSIMLYEAKAQVIGANRLPAGSPVVLGTFTAPHSYGNVTLAAHPDGGFVVSWPQYEDHNRPQFKAQLFDGSGAPVGSRFELAGGPGQTIAVLEDGTFVAAWVNGDSYGSGVVARLYSPANEPVFDNSGDDILTGDSGPNVLDGGAGNDQLHGLGGNDDLRGGGGHDRLEGGEGDDMLQGGAGDDTLSGGPGDDGYAGGEGVDTLDFSGESGPVVVNFHPVFGFTPDSADPTFLVGPGEAVDSFGNREAVSGIENLVLTAGDDSVLASDSDNRIEGGGGRDNIHGMDGNDVLLGGAGRDSLLGESGEDRLEGGDDGDFLFGDSGDDVIEGGAGDDLADGGDNNDSIDGGDGADEMLGQGGDDDLSGGAGQDIIRGGTGNDQLFGDAGDDTLTGGPGTDSYSGGDGTDTVDFSGEPGGVVVSLQGPLHYAPPSLVGRPVAPGEARDGFGNYDTVSGVENFKLTASKDYFLGGDDPNRVEAGGGDDSVVGGGGNDILFGGDGKDVVIGDWGDDLLEGGGDDDILIGNQGKDEIDGGAGNDSAWGGADNDFIIGAAGDDMLAGDDGHDSLSGGDGDDILSGGSGVDSFQGGSDTGSIWGDRVSFQESRATQGVVADLRSGIISNDGFGNAETMTGIESFGPGTAFADTFYGNDDPNALFLERGDFVYGFGGDDLIEAGLAPAVVEGGAGTDTLLLRADGDFLLPDMDGDGVAEWSPTMTAGWKVDLFAGTIRDGFGNEGMVAGIENLVGTGLADDLRGNSGDNAVTGGGGDDSVRLQDGGNDTVLGGAGNDWFLFGAALTGADIIDGGEGKDEVTLQGDYSGGLTLGAVTGVEVMVLLPGNDVRFGAPGNQLYSYSITTTDLNVASGVQLSVDANRLRVGENLVFDGSAETDGSFYIYAGKGVDTLTGGAKNDAFLFRGPGNFTGADTVNGGAGFDELALRGDYTGAHKVVFGATTISGIEAIVVVSGHDLRYGKFAGDYSFDLTMNEANVQSGQAMIVDAGTLRSGERLVFDGSAETDGGRFTMFGGQGNDTLTGGSGSDSIRGGLGADAMKGNGGADTFVYRTPADSANGAADHILDFVSGTDRIDLSRIDANSLAAGNQAFNWIGSNAFSGSGASSAGQLRAYQDGASWFVEGDTNGDGTADLIIQVTGGALVQGDFLP